MTNPALEECYAATIVHPDGRLELLYAYRTPEEAAKCINAYARAKGYDGAVGYQALLLNLVLRDKFEEAHNEGTLIGSKAIVGEHTHEKEN